jgi:nonsense-mediated mRNA decay protein 3
MSRLFCPNCGRNVGKTYDGLCSDCFIDKLELIHYPKVLNAKRCPNCGYYFIKGKWTRDVVLEAISEVKMNEEAKDDEMIIKDEIGEDEISLHITAIATVRGIRVEKEADMEIMLKSASCERCSRIASGYYESIVQVRADGRALIEEELKKCEEIAYKESDMGGDRMAFVKVKEIKAGMDIYVGRKSLGRKIAKSIIGELGGKYSESAKIFGRKDGRNVYRTTLVVRLPRFTRGDVIIMGEDVIIVEQSEKRLGLNLERGTKVVYDDAELLCNVRDARETVLVAVDDAEAQVLDPDDYRLISLKKPSFLNQDGGTEVLVIKTRKGLFFVPDECRKDDKYCSPIYL